MKLNIGVILRSYAKTPELVPEMVERAARSVRQALSVTFNGGEHFEKILIAIPKDYDCGETQSALTKRFTEENLLEEAEIFPCRGHHSCRVLNDAMQYLQSNGNCKFGLILSNKAIGYLTNETMERVSLKLLCWYRVVAVRIKELNDVQESPIQNTFAVWDLKTFFGPAGGFETEFGVEEIAPLVRLIQHHGPCAAIINAEGSLDIRKSEDGQARHKEVRGTKRALQQQEAERLGVTLDWIKSNISGL